MKTPVFLSWSGPRSRAVAEALNGWLPRVLQMCDPWYSPNAIEAGARWSDTLAKPLAAYKCGIICLTPENLHADWLLYEAGCLSRTPDEETRVVPYLYGLQPAEVGGPFAQFQMKKADEPGTRDIVRALNDRLQSPLSASVLDDAFADQWPKLLRTLDSIPRSSAGSPPRRDPAEMLEETLTMVRDIARRDGREVDELSRRVRALLDDLAAAPPGRTRGRRPVSKSARDPRSAREAAFHAVVAYVLAECDLRYGEPDRFVHDRKIAAERALHRAADEAVRCDPRIDVPEMVNRVSELLGR